MALLRWLKKSYVFAFYAQYRFATSFGNSAWGEENAVFCMGLLLGTLSLETICAVALVTHRTPVNFPKVAVLLWYSLLLLFIYWTLVRKHQWLTYKSEFENYSRRKHFFASLGVGSVVALAFIGIGVVKAAIRVLPL